MDDWTRRTALAGFVAMGTGTAGMTMAAMPGSPPPSGAGSLRSWLDFIPPARHSAILGGTDRSDLTAILQHMLDELPPGALVFAPGRVNVEGTLVLRRSITLYGAAGRENFDNSWDRGGGGTEIIYRGQSGDILRIEGALEGNGCFNVMLRDFIVRGNRLDDRGMPNPRSTGGDGIAVRGSREETSNIRIDFDNVHVAQAAGHGISLTGHVFGGSIRNAFLHRNGRNGLHVGGAAGVGEMWLARLRLFQNGRDGATAGDMAGMFWRAGSMLASQVSASESGGAGAMLSGGPIQIDMLQLESNGQAVADPLARRQLVIGNSDSGTPSTHIGALLSDAGRDYRGAHVHVAGNAYNVRLDGLMVATLGPGGRHLVRDAGSQNLDISGLVGCRVIEDRSADTMTRAGVQVFARIDRAPTTRTGDGTPMPWRPAQILRNDLSTYDPRSGTFTAPISGLYDLEAVLPLAGLDAEHRSATLAIQATSVARIYRPGNLGAMCDSEGRYTIQARARIPMVQGETVQVICTVAGGSRTVTSAIDPREGFLTITLP